MTIVQESLNAKSKLFGSCSVPARCGNLLARTGNVPARFWQLLASNWQPLATFGNFWQLRSVLRNSLSGRNLGIFPALDGKILAKKIISPGLPTSRKKQRFPVGSVRL